jgi:hypothetical protein
MQELSLDQVLDRFGQVGPLEFQRAAVDRGKKREIKPALLCVVAIG